MRSFCNHPGVLKIYEELSQRHELIPILSENAAKYDTRFGTAEHLLERVESLAGRRAVRTIVEAEPLGPSNAMDVLVIAPCTGNTLAKLAAGVTDGCVMKGYQQAPPRRSNPPWPARRSAPELY